MEVMLKNITHNPGPFFDILPKDWQDSILPFWNVLKETSKVYVLDQDREICAGGIIFSTLIPEMEGYEAEANYWYSKDYLYIGYVWVPQYKRNKNFGSKWLNHILQLDNKQHYWLTTEDKALRYFYEKMGFSYVKTLCFNHVEEELFVFDN